MIRRKLDITMIPNQTGGKPGHYLKPSMLMSCRAAPAPEPTAAKLMDFFLIDDPEGANDILRIERGVLGRRSVRQRIAGSLTSMTREDSRSLSRRRRNACEPIAASAAAEERRRDSNARCAPADTSIAFKKVVRVKHGATDYYENAKTVLARA